MMLNGRLLEEFNIEKLSKNSQIILIDLFVTSMLNIFCMHEIGNLEGFFKNNKMIQTIYTTKNY